MINMKDKNEIIQLHLEGRSNRFIARRTGFDRKTVNKYVNEYEKNREALEAADKNDKDTLRRATEQITAPPTYKKRKWCPRKWNEEMDFFLDKILKQEEAKKKLLRTNKQQRTKKQIHELMREEGYNIGYTTVCNKITEKRNKTKEAYIAQHYRFGERFEFDFGEVHLLINGQNTKLYLAAMCAPASQTRYALLYRNQKQEVFIDAQVRFFEYMGGRFEEGVYDNMRNVVKKFIGKNEKELNDELVKLAHYYGFRINVTNCYSGNEKGSVERTVEVVRNAAFATKWEFDSFEQAQAHLFACLEKLNANKPLDREREALRAYAAPYETADIRTHVNVDKYSCIQVDKVFYSVPEHFVGKSVCVKLYPNEVIALHSGQEIARHMRSFTTGERVLEINHYLNTFIRKPGALANSSALQAKEELKSLFEKEYRNNPKAFISILNACKNESQDITLQALKLHKPPKEQPVKNAHIDAIEAQTMNQIASIEVIGRAVA